MDYVSTKLKANPLKGPSSLCSYGHRVWSGRATECHLLIDAIDAGRPMVNILQNLMKEFASLEKS